MTQRQADQLRREWRLLHKIGFAPNWTPAQKAERRAEILNMLTAAGQALPKQEA